MKKLLLTALCVFGLASMASAETYTINTKDLNAGKGDEWSVTAQGFTLDLKKNNGKTAPTINGSAGDMRIYAKGTLAISVADVNITSISFTISKQGKKRLTDITPSVGEIVEQGKNPLVWNGEASEVTFTVGDKATYGTDGESNAGQFDFDVITITTDGEVVGGEVDPQEPEDLPEIDSLTPTIGADAGIEFIMACDLTVVYVSGGNVYVYDGVNYAMLFKAGLGVQAGDIIAAGWKAKTDDYNGLSEIVPQEALTVKGTGTVPDPIEVEAEDVEYQLQAYNQNRYFKLIGVTFDTATPAADAVSADRNITGKMGDAEVLIRNNYKLASVPAGTYDVKGFVGVYNGTVQFYPIEYSQTSGIAGIEAENTPVRYYNIQGVEVANPMAGQLYIRVQGGKAVKVIR